MKTLASTSLILLIFLFLSCKNEHRDEPEKKPEPFVFNCSRYPLTGYYIPQDLTIPENVLDTISTDRLLLSCLHFPFWQVIGLSSSNDYLPMFNRFFEKNEATFEYFSRDYAHQYIYERYLCVGVEDLRFNNVIVSFHLELFLLFPPVFLQFNTEEKLAIMDEAIETYENLFSKTGEYSIYSAVLIGKILKNLNYQPFIEFENNTSYLYQFLVWGDSSRISFESMNRIIEFGKEYLKTN